VHVSKEYLKGFPKGEINRMSLALFIINTEKKKYKMFPKEYPISVWFRKLIGIYSDTPRAAKKGL